MASWVLSSPRIVQLHCNRPTGNVSIIIALLYLLRVQYRERSARCIRTFFEIGAGEGLLFQRIKSLVNDQLILLQKSTILVEVVRFKLNRVIGKPPARITEADNPDRPFR